MVPPRTKDEDGMAKKALITGITGQDGSYLAELLLSKDYEVHGIIRRASTFNTERIDHLYQDPHINGVRLFLHFGDMADSTNLIKLLYRIQPEEIYHLAAQSHVRVSFDIPEYTGDVTGLGTVRILEAIRETGLKAKFYQASSSEMYGKVHEVPQRETFHQADVLMEGLSNLSPRRLHTLLVACRNVKVKRLFLWFAERHQHAWLKKLDRKHIDLGHGKRMLVRGGKLDTKFNITVPESIDAGG